MCSPACMNESCGLHFGNKPFILQAIGDDVTNVRLVIWVSKCREQIQSSRGVVSAPLSVALLEKKHRTRGTRRLEFELCITGDNWQMNICA